MLIKPTVYNDSRGYFYECYNKQAFKNLGIDIPFVQDNQSLSSYGTIRGLHYQLVPFAQTKLIRVIFGKILDVAVDMRCGSSTYGKWYSVELSGENFLQLLIPQGFAHGFSVLSEKAVVLYKTDDFYKKESERGIVYNDSGLGIDWKIAPSDILVSEKDKNLQRFESAEANFIL